MAKTANVGRLSVSLVANTAQYTGKLKAAQKDTEKYSKKTKKSLVKSSKASAKGLGILVTAVAAAVVVAEQMATAYVQAEKQMRGLADTAGLTTKELRAQAYALSSTGVTVDQLADNYKDLSDKIGEYTSTGSGVFQDFVDVMKMTKSEGQALAQELQYLSGPEVTQRLVSEMKKAKVPMSQMVFVMESLGNDSSRTARMLAENGEEVAKLAEEYKSLSIVASETSIKAFDDLSNQVSLLFNNLGAMATNALAPIMNAYTNIIKNINELLPKDAENQFSDYGDKVAKDLQSSFSGVTAIEKQKGTLEGLNNELFIQRMNLKKLKGEFKTVSKYSYVAGKDIEYKVVANPEGIEETMVKIQSLENKIKKTAEVTEQMEVEKVKLTADANKELAKIGQDYNSNSLEGLKNRYYKELQMLRDTYGAKYSETQAYQDAEQRLLDNHAKKSAELYMKQRQEELDKEKEFRDKKNQLREMAVTEGSLEQIELNQELEMIALEEGFDAKLRATEEYEAAKKAIEKKYQDEKTAYEEQALQRTIALNQAKIATELGTMEKIGQGLEGFAEQSKSLALAAFAFNQSTAIANMLVEQQAAVAQAWGDESLPWYSKAFVAANAALQVGGAIAQVKSVAVGQAHDGMDEVKQEGSWILDKGERVVQPEANKDLTAYLNKQKSESMGKPNNYVINAPLNLSDKNIIDPKEFDAMLVKHRTTIAGSVRKTEKERPMTRRK
jgi:hypothetical protein